MRRAPTRVCWKHKRNFALLETEVRHTLRQNIWLEVKSTCLCSEMSQLRTFSKFTCSRSHRVILYIVTNDCGEESLLGKTEWCKATQERQRGGLKGRDLSGLDCVLIEVTCIKWNLIGTDTGSLTDRHDADGLRGGRKGEWGRQGKEEGVVERRVVQSWKGRTETNERFLSATVRGQTARVLWRQTWK